MLSHARSARIFHPDGLVCQGHALLSGDTPLPLSSGPVTARVSKGIGTPGALPDIVGLAVRLPVTAPAAADDRAHPVWDLLLAGPAPLGGRLPLRLLTTRWSGPTVSILTPFRHDDSLYWVRAHIVELDDLLGCRSTSYAQRRIATAGSGELPTPDGQDNIRNRSPTMVGRPSMYRAVSGSSGHGGIENHAHRSRKGMVVIIAAAATRKSACACGGMASGLCAKVMRLNSVSHNG
ncbi:MAG: hypothetical protein SW127_21815, partial [Actinomycetota bacterium]|nr:hypothetical protein [Actinomycetota bacterium]